MMSDDLQQKIEDLEYQFKSEKHQWQLKESELQQALERQQQINERFQKHVADTRPISPNSSQLEVLQLKLEEMKQALQSANENSAQGFIDKVADVDAVLVAFHPAAGHLTITANHMLTYSQDPMAYAAKKCHVSTPLYCAWLAHYEMPKCHRCAIKIDAVQHPKDFEQGLSDACKLHRQLGDYQS